MYHQIARNKRNSILVVIGFLVVWLAVGLIVGWLADGQVGAVPDGEAVIRVPKKLMRHLEEARGATEL